MLAVRCLVFAAVSARFAVTGWSSSVSDRGDGETWEWQPAEEQGDRGPAVEEVTQPKRLLQQIDSEGELVHRHLDTRVKNHTEGAQPVHLAQSSFLVEAFGKSFILDLELNHNLLSSDYVERHFDDEGRPSQNMRTSLED